MVIRRKPPVKKRRGKPGPRPNERRKNWREVPIPNTNQSLIMIRMLIKELQEVERDAMLLDKGNRHAGQRLRTRLLRVRRAIHRFIPQVQKQRYYIEAQNHVNGVITFIKNEVLKNKKMQPQKMSLYRKI